ncbi:MAG: hypothetical protein EOO73_27490 [Myxococcales bacterium]|nr:MAG: hypothetical protein EOO73_27490 [Myxococcales bacterium]
MIAHVSMPADDCALVAQVLAQMLDGGALRFPPGGPSAWNCWSRDNGFQIVVTPRGQVMVPGPHEQAWRSSQPASSDRACESHFAMAVPRSAAEIMTLAETVGWQARICSRGGMFDVVELWVEGAYLVELLDPAQLADYRRTMTTENWKRVMDLP